MLRHFFIFYTNVKGLVSFQVSLNEFSLQTEHLFKNRLYTYIMSDRNRPRPDMYREKTDT